MPGRASALFHKNELLFTMFRWCLGVRRHSTIYQPVALGSSRHLATARTSGSAQAALSAWQKNAGWAAVPYFSNAQRKELCYMESLLNLAGAWRYRSFKNEPEHLSSFDDLKYGEGNLEVETSPSGIFTGKLTLETRAELTLKGTVSYGYPCIIHFRGTGEENTMSAGWIYDYTGFLAPDWLNGIDQRSAIIGTNIRTAPHDNQPAGYVASWIAVRQ
jgi:hypothetical protein